MIQSLQSSAGQVWVAARSSVPLTSAYRYNPNDSGICALPGAGLTVYALYANGLSRDITEEAHYSTVDSRIARISDHGTIIGLRSGGTMLDISYRGVKTRVKVHVVERSAEAYNEAISLRSAHGSGGYSGISDGTSVCQRFVEDVLWILGLSLPSKAWKGDFRSWINRQEARCSGWYEVKDQKEALRLANLGHPVLAVGRESVNLLNPSNNFPGKKAIRTAGILRSKCRNIAGFLGDSQPGPVQCFVHV